MTEELVKRHVPIDGYPVKCPECGCLWPTYRIEQRGRTLRCDRHEVQR